MRRLKRDPSRRAHLWAATAAWQQLQGEQEQDRKGEDWAITEREIEAMAEIYWHEERDGLRGAAMSETKPSPKARLQAIYDSLPKIECQKKCAAFCGPILMSGLEERRITDRRGPIAPAGLDLHCSLLNQETGECSVYRLRPLICRLWGVVDALPCPHGCLPERYLTRAESYALLAEGEALSKEAGFED